MKLPAPLALFLCTALAALAAPPRTMRVDYVHTGTATTEHFSLERVVVEPLPFPGNPARPVDGLDLGQYAFQVADKATGRVLYARGFNSIYGEWETTGEAKRMHRSFQESLRFPTPEAPVRVTLRKRDPRNAWKEVWGFDLDPRDKFVDPSLPPSPGALLELQKTGEPSGKVDLLILGDGYMAAERGKFEQDARRMMDMLFAQSPFKERRGDFNVWGLCPPAMESGISRPSTGLHRRSPLGCSYDAFDSERYVLTYENRAWRDVAAFAPYDAVEILVNGRTYGGGGIYNLYGTVASDNAFAPYIFVHEFGHHFAGLADEYYTSDVAYETGKARIEPWELNVTADPARPKWSALLTPGLPLPTPWRKQAFEAHSYEMKRIRNRIRAENRPESEMEDHFRREQKEDSRLLGTDTHSGKVGAFEGANYEATGYYRSQTDCIMFTRDEVGFCAACRAALEKVIDSYAKGK